MKSNLKDIPRIFEVGNDVKFSIKDYGNITLESNEQVTFLTGDGAEYDVARKDWGFYATPSLNGRLEKFGLRGVLIRNINTNRYFIFLVEKGKESLFNEYLCQEKLEIITWLDTELVLDNLVSKLSDDL